MDLLSSFEGMSIGVVAILLVAVTGVLVFFRNLRMPPDFERKQEERKKLKEKTEELEKKQ